MRKYFITRIAVKLFFIAVISIIISTILRSPVITNNLAMTQMQNSDDLYIAVSMYEKFIPAAEWILSGARLFISASICNDLYYIFNEEKEN